MKRKHKIVCILLVLALFLPLLTACADHYDTTDLAEYGHIHGNGKQIDRLAQEDFDTYFPAEIDPSWEDVQYHYHAYDLAPGYEIDLEFVIPDQAEFDAYVATVAPIEEFHQFPYDEAFLEYLYKDVWIDVIYETDDDTGEKHSFTLDNTYIEETLIAPAERRVVIVVLRVADPEYIENVDWFFKRFDIDIMDYVLDLQKIAPERAHILKWDGNFFTNG